MYEMPSCYGHEERKARKAHKCCECHGTIQHGEKYHFHHGVWDGKASDYKVCSDCEALRAECDRDARYDECTPFEGLNDSVEGIGEPGLLARFIEIKRRRGATVPQWMATQADTTNARSYDPSDGDVSVDSVVGGDCATCGNNDADIELMQAAIKKRA